MADNFKILMVNPPFLPEHGRFSRYNRSPGITKSGTLYYPLWLSFATGVLEKAGFDVRLIDCPAQRIDLNGLLEIVTNFKPDLVCIETSTPSIYDDINTAKSIKAVIPDKKICMTGTHVSALPDETLKMAPGVDYIARGEYDYTLLELAHRLAGRGDTSGIPGISSYVSEVSSSPASEYNDLCPPIHPHSSNASKITSIFLVATLIFEYISNPSSQIISTSF